MLFFSLTMILFHDYDHLLILFQYPSNRILPNFFQEVGAVFHHGVLTQLQDFGFFLDSELQEVEDQQVVFLITEIGIGGFQSFVGMGIHCVESLEDALALVAT